MLILKGDFKKMAEKKNILLTTPHGDMVISVNNKDYEVVCALLYRESHIWETESKALKGSSYHIFNELGQLLKKHDIEADYYEISSIVTVRGVRRSEIGT